MEGINGSFLDDEEWESLSKLLSIEDDSDNFLLHLNGNMFQNNSQTPSTFLSAADYNESNLFIPSNFDFISQESSSEIGSSPFPNKSKENHMPSGVNVHHDHTNFSLDQSMNFHTMDREDDNSMLPIFSDDAMGRKLNAKTHPLEPEDFCKEVQVIKRKYKRSDKDNSSESPNKKPRKNKRNVQPKKNKKADQVSINEEENSSGRIANSSSTNSNSEDDSINASEELNSKGKARSSRGSANDPQSLYARRRRERINERMKVLQDLVPNGTKVDISTMLEEAVHYVKFLQLQIKLLSSDDLWMYAPIVYNGMDIGLYQKIVPNMCI